MNIGIIFRGNSIRENTIASLKKAAASGADMLEFDVQLSKDMIPVIYHDFYVCISMKRKKEINFTEMLELPVKDLTLEHLQKLKVQSDVLTSVKIFKKYLFVFNYLFSNHLIKLFLLVNMKYIFNRNRI